MYDKFDKVMLISALLDSKTSALFIGQVLRRTHQLLMSLKFFL